MTQNALVALSIVDPDNPYAHIAVRGKIVSATEEGADASIDALAKKYLGQDKYPFRQPGRGARASTRSSPRRSRRWAERVGERDSPRPSPRRCAALGGRGARARRRRRASSRRRSAPRRARVRDALFGPRRDVLAEGLPAAHEPLPKPLRLLLVPPLAGRPGRVDDDARRDRASSSRARASSGCAEALFCLGDKPEKAFSAYRAHARVARARRAPSSTCTGPGAKALAHGLLPHTNAGILTDGGHDAAQGGQRQPGPDARVRRARASASPGCRTTARPTSGPTGACAMIDAAGRAAHPVHDGHPRRHRRDAARAGREPARDPRARTAQHGHIQEVIVQNFRAVPGVPMEPRARARRRRGDARRGDGAPHPRRDVSLQAPPNLNPASAEALLASGLNDFGGISPVTPDYINPRHPWPHVDALGEACARAGLRACARARRSTTAYVDRPGFLDPATRSRADARPCRRGSPRRAARHEPRARCSTRCPGDVRRVLERALEGRDLARRRRGAPVRRPRAVAARARRRGRPPPPRAGRRRGRRTSSTATSTSPTCASRRAASARSRARSGAKRATSCRSRRSCGARSRRRRSARRRSASRRASRPGVDARFYVDLVRALKAAAPDAARARAVARGGEVRGASASGWSFRRVLEEHEGRRARLAARHVGRGARRPRARAHRARAHHDRRVDRGRHDGARDRPAARRRRSCTATSRRTWSGCGTSSCCGRSSGRRAASPSSCRCRSCTKRRR